MSENCRRLALRLLCIDTWLPRLASALDWPLELPPMDECTEECTEEWMEEWTGLGDAADTGAPGCLGEPDAALCQMNGDAGSGADVWLACAPENTSRCLLVDTWPALLRSGIRGGPWLRVDAASLPPCPLPCPLLCPL